MRIFCNCILHFWHMLCRFLELMRVQNLQILVKAVPVREGHNLEIMFPITPEIQNYTVAPSRYLGHLIGHEADGSLFALLKKLGEKILTLLCSARVCILLFP